MLDTSFVKRMAANPNAEWGKKTGNQTTNKLQKQRLDRQMAQEERNPFPRPIKKHRKRSVSSEVGPDHQQRS